VAAAAHQWIGPRGLLAAPSLQLLASSMCANLLTRRGHHLLSSDPIMSSPRRPGCCCCWCCLSCASMTGICRCRPRRWAAGQYAGSLTRLLLLSPSNIITTIVILRNCSDIQWQRLNPSMRRCCRMTHASSGMSTNVYTCNSCISTSDKPFYRLRKNRLNSYIVPSQRQKVVLYF